MKHTTSHIHALLLALAVCAAVPAVAADPPDRLNYQGVLRAADDAPLDGSYTMVFRLFDAAAAGNELLVNAPSPVVVTNGLFNVALGTGGVADGSGPGVYTTLGQVFADFADVWLEIEVDGETLAPRVPILAAAYALNAGTLGGRDAAGFLDVSATAQSKAGPLALGDLDVAGSLVIAGGGAAAGRVLTSDGAGQATWQSAPAAAPAPLRELADRLDTVDPGTLPFASTGGFDCSGGASATLSFTLNGTATGDVVGFLGRDAISNTYEYLIALESPTVIATAAQIGALGRLTIARNATTTTFSGRVTEFGQSAFDGGLHTYVVRLEPQLAELDRATDYRVRQNVTIGDLVSDLLSDSGIGPSAYQLVGSYPERDMVIRYGEPGVDFLRRVAGEAGVFFFFDEVAGGERVNFTDTNSMTPALAGALPYYGDMAVPGTGEEFVSTFHQRSRLTSHSATVRGYDRASPVFIAATSTTSGGVGERYEFSTAVTDTGDAAKLAAVALQRDLTLKSQYTGSGNAAALKAGHRFTLTDSAGSGLGGSYLVTEITHFALRDPDPSCIEYGNVFSAQPAVVPYRPARSPRPHVDGPIAAIVTGPAGETRYTDGEGRIKVQFHWDRDGGGDENSSAWIPVATPPGRTDDRQWIPEIGDEVLVQFEQGDPDRPIVVGSLYNGADTPPTADDLVIRGSGISLRSEGPDGDQAIGFYNAGIPSSKSLLWDDSADRFVFTDDLEVTDLTLSGNDLFFGVGSRLYSTTATTMGTVGVDPTDDLLLLAGASANDGALNIFGDSTFEMRSGNGLFSFINGANGGQTGFLSPGGDLQIDGDAIISGGDVFLGAGARLSNDGSQLTITAGDIASDDLVLAAGTSVANGGISIFGGSFIEQRSPFGTFTYVAVDTGFVMSLLQSSATLNDWQFGAANLNLSLGDSAADTVFVPGSFQVAGTKNFVQNHPERDDLSIVYTALEGGEAGTYTRGSARLVNGVARVPLEATFALVTNPDYGLTAHVTPRGGWADLWVESVSTGELVVRSAPDSDADAEFDFVIYGLRLGYEEYALLQPRRMDSSVPSPEYYDHYYAGRESLRESTAAARFRRMDLELGRAPRAPERAAELRAAVGVRAALRDDDGDDSDDLAPRREVAADVDRPADVGALPEDAAPGATDPAEPPLAVARTLRTTDSELATAIDVHGEASLGDLVVVDPADPSRMVPASRAADPTVVGIVSGRPGVLLGGATDTTDEATAVAFSGIVLANVDAGYGAVRVGDLLTSSPTVGHAMRVIDPLPGTVVAKALEGLESGTGTIRVLVMAR